MTDTRTVELWMDELNAIWAVDAGNGRIVRTPRCLTADEFPAAITDLAENGPIALSWPNFIQEAEYGDHDSSVPTQLTWVGETWLHLTPDLDKSRLSYILPFFGRVLKAAKDHIHLDSAGKVNFILSDERPIALASDMQYGNEAPHYGLIITWKVQQELSGQI
jgi:hypothetical protein